PTPPYIYPLSLHDALPIYLTSLRCDAPSDYVLLDAATQTNLELVESRSARDTSLLAVLDRTVTPMGGRKLRDWILQPLRNLTELDRKSTRLNSSHEWISYA